MQNVWLVPVLEHGIPRSDHCRCYLVMVGWLCVCARVHDRARVVVAVVVTVVAAAAAVVVVGVNRAAHE